MLSKQQKQQLKQHCPLCAKKLIAVGDLADEKHDLIICENFNNCPYTMLYSGEIITK